MVIKYHYYSEIYQNVLFTRNIKISRGPEVDFPFFVVSYRGESQLPRTFDENDELKFDVASDTENSDDD